MQPGQAQRVIRHILVVGESCGVDQLDGGGGGLYL